MVAEEEEEDLKI